MLNADNDSLHLHIQYEWNEWNELLLLIIIDYLSDLSSTSCESSGTFLATADATSALLLLFRFLLLLQHLV
jgi:hypothetical protein